MATFTWALDITDGVMLNHALSAKIRYASIAKSIFMQYVRAEPGFGRRKGQSITIQRIKSLAEPTSALLTAGTRIPIDKISLSTTIITVHEYGRGVEYEDLANQLNNFDLEQPMQKRLREQMTLTLDTNCAAAFKTAKVCFIPTSLSGGTWDTDGTPSTSASQNLTIAHLGVIRDYMTDTLFVPPYEGETYIGIASTKALRGIKNDPEFVEWRKYIQPGDVLFKSEVGMVEQIRLIECNHTAALSNAVGTGSVLGEAVIFGDDPVVMAEVLTPHLRAALPGDFGRIKAVAWYGILEFGLVWDTANAGEANVIRICSA
jgi:N4-gp56 family major capsid protein